MRNTSAQLVVNRLRCLYVCFLRTHAEAQKRKRDAGLTLPVRISVDEQMALCQQALQDENLRATWTSEERGMVGARLGSLGVWECRAGMYCADAINVLALALGIVKGKPAPMHERFVVTRRPFTPASIVGPRMLPSLAKPKLLPPESLNRIARTYEAYAWRARLQILTLTGAFTESDDAREAIDRFVALQVARRCKQCVRQGLFKSIRGDFSVGRRSYADYFAKEVSFASGEEFEVSQTLRAARWLLAPRTPWDKARAPSPPRFTIPKRLKGDSSSGFVRSHFDPEVNFASFKYAC